MAIGKLGTILTVATVIGGLSIVGYNYNAYADVESDVNTLYNNGLAWKDAYTVTNGTLGNTQSELQDTKNKLDVANGKISNVVEYLTGKNITVVKDGDEYTAQGIKDGIDQLVLNERADQQSITEQQRDTATLEILNDIARALGIGSYETISACETAIDTELAELDSIISDLEGAKGSIQEQVNQANKDIAQANKDMQEIEKLLEQKIQDLGTPSNN